MQILLFVLVGLPQIIAAFFIPIQYQPVLGMILVMLGVKTYDFLRMTG
jgi:hypothetical protein